MTDNNGLVGHRRGGAYISKGSGVVVVTAAMPLSHHNGGRVRVRFANKHLGGEDIHGRSSPKAGIGSARHERGEVQAGGIPSKRRRKFFPPVKCPQPTKPASYTEMARNSERPAGQEDGANSFFPLLQLAWRNLYALNGWGPRAEKRRAFVKHETRSDR